MQDRNKSKNKNLNNANSIIPEYNPLSEAGRRLQEKIAEIKGREDRPITDEHADEKWRLKLELRSKKKSIEDADNARKSALKIKEDRKFLHRERQEKINNLNEDHWPQIKDEFERRAMPHLMKIIINLNKSIKYDEYGSLLHDNRNQELARFMKSVRLEHQLTRFGISPFMIVIRRLINEREAEMSQNGFNPGELPTDGVGFEEWVAESLRVFGWTASTTKATGDQGVDVIAEQNKIKIAIQCKLYSGSVGNKAVQEVYSGMKHNALNCAAVISTGNYTKSAHELSKSTGVILISHLEIPELYKIASKL